MCADSTTADQPTAEASGLFRGPGLGSGIGDAREAAAGAAELVAHVQRIVTDLENGAKGVTITVGPVTVWGVVIPAIPIRFRLTQ